MGKFEDDLRRILSLGLYLVCGLEMVAKKGKVMRPLKQYGGQTWNSGGKNE